MPRVFDIPDIYDDTLGVDDTVNDELLARRGWWQNCITDNDKVSAAQSYIEALEEALQIARTQRDGACENVKNICEAHLVLTDSWASAVNERNTLQREKANKKDEPDKPCPTCGRSPWGHSCPIKCDEF